MAAENLTKPLGDEEVDWDYFECMHNGGKDVDWGHWMSLAHLTPHEASCLSYAVDPNYFANPTPKHWENSSFQDVLKIIRQEVEKRERWLERKYGTAGELSPANWIDLFRENGFSLPPALRLMAAAATPQRGSTEAANASRKDNKDERLKDLQKFIDDIYAAARERKTFSFEKNGKRNPLPFSADVLHSVFTARHPNHKVALATFKDNDLPKIDVRVKPGPKRCTARHLTDLLAGKL